MRLRSWHDDAEPRCQCPTRRTPVHGDGVGTVGGDVRPHGVPGDRGRPGPLRRRLRVLQQPGGAGRCSTTRGNRRRRGGSHGCADRRAHTAIGRGSRRLGARDAGRRARTVGHDRSPRPARRGPDHRTRGRPHRDLPPRRRVEGPQCLGRLGRRLHGPGHRARGERQTRPPPPRHRWPRLPQARLPRRRR